jgi:hypothetical protein
VSGDPRPIVASGTGPPAAAAYLPRRIQTPPTYQQRREHGRAARQRTPRGIHAGWAPASDRPDPVDLLGAQAKNRDQRDHAALCAAVESGRVTELLSAPEESCSSTQTCKDVYAGHFAK